MRKRTKEKIGIYGANILVRPLSNTLVKLLRMSNLEGKIGLGNPSAALFYGALDIVGAVSPKIKENRYVRLSQLIGAFGYSASSFKDLYDFANGNVSEFLQLPFKGRCPTILISNLKIIKIPSTNSSSTHFSPRYFQIFFKL